MGRATWTNGFWGNPCEISDNILWVAVHSITMRKVFSAFMNRPCSQGLTHSSQWAPISCPRPQWTFHPETISVLRMSLLSMFHEIELLDSVGFEVERTLNRPTIYRLQNLFLYSPLIRSTIHNQWQEMSHLVSIYYYWILILKKYLIVFMWDLGYFYLENKEAM